jgi:hypothetical protein
MRYLFKTMARITHKDIFVPEHSYAYINIDYWTDDYELSTRS